MTRKYDSYDFGIWMDNVDVNSLTDEECAAISSVDIEKDDDLNWLVNSWIKPRYLIWDQKNRDQMKEILRQSAEWSEVDLRKVCDEAHLPSGQKVKDIGRFIRALKAGILE